MIELIILAVVVFWLLGGAHSHRRHYRQHGAHPNLWWNYRRGWFGSIRVPLIGGRYSHKL